MEACFEMGDRQTLSELLRRCADFDSTAPSDQHHVRDLLLPLASLLRQGSNDARSLIDPVAFKGFFVTLCTALVDIVNRSTPAEHADQLLDFLKDCGGVSFMMET
jgi:hypothetical protein